MSSWQETESTQMFSVSGSQPLELLTQYLDLTLGLLHQSLGLGAQALVVFKSSLGDVNVAGRVENHLFKRVEFNEGTTYRDLGRVKETENGMLKHSGTSKKRGRR